jgi:hypothetical protein
MPKKYNIKPLFLLVRDEKSTKFHVENNDYFGTIATVLSLMKQEINKSGLLNIAAFNKTLKNIEKDLLFLQKNYQINPKIRNKNKTPKGKLISQ